MSDDSNTNLSFILNKSSSNNLAENTNSNARNFLYSIFLIILIYFSVIYFNEIKLFFTGILYKDIPIEKEKSITKMDNLKIQKVVKNSYTVNKEFLIENNKSEIIKPKTQKNEEKVLDKNIIIEKYKLLPSKDKRDLFIEIYNSDNFKVFQCDNYKINRYKLDAICKTNLKKFLDKNENAIKFEVLALAGENDIKYYSKYKDYLEETLILGISDRRIQEIISTMKTHLTNQIIVPKSYYIKSDNNTSSIRIKAYY